MKMAMHDTHKNKINRLFYIKKVKYMSEVNPCIFSRTGHISYLFVYLFIRNVFVLSLSQYVIQVYVQSSVSFAQEFIDVCNLFVI